MGQHGKWETIIQLISSNFQRKNQWEYQNWLTNGYCQRETQWLING